MNTDRLFLTFTPLLKKVIGPTARRRLARFRSVPVTPGRVVFLGDSITEGGTWEELFPELPTLNRGIGGDSTEDVLARLDEAINAPAAVNLLIGTNDLHLGPRLSDLDGIATRVGQIVSRIQQKAPAASIYLNSVMPRTTLLTSRIRSLNERYVAVAARTGVTYVDLWPALADGRGELRGEFTTDHLHLKDVGYVAWSQVLRPLLMAYRWAPVAGAPDMTEAS